MTVIQTIGQIGMERAHECADEVGKKFLKSVKPIYGANSKEPPLPILIGTCMFLKVSGKPFLVTAAHVTDEHRNTSLYVGAGASLHPINAEFWCTQAPEGGRENDQLDYAFWQIPDDVVDVLGDIEFIEESDLSLNRGTMSGRQFMVLGYPIRRNRTIRARGHKVLSRAWTYQESYLELSDDDLKLTGCSRENNLFLKYDNRAGDYTGETDNVISPRGASGGALIDLGIPNPANLSKDSPCVGRLSGLFIERLKKPRVLIFVKINLIIEQIYETLNANTA